MVQTGGRVTRRQDLSEFVDSGELEISSSGDELSSSRALATRRSQRSAAKSSHLPLRGRSRTFYNLSSDEDSEATASARRTARRSIRLRVRSESHHEVDSEVEDSEEEITEGSEAEEAIQDMGRRRAIKKRRGRPPTDPRGAVRQKISHGADSGSDYIQKRRSSRTKAVPRRDMRERGEDEISDLEVKAAGTKIITAKEKFVDLAEDDPFRLRHRQNCETCGFYENEEGKGPLTFCQGCTDSYHISCLGPRGSRDHLVTKVGPGDFVLQCRRCIDVPHKKDNSAPELSLCQKCKTPGLACAPFRAKKSTKQEQIEREANEGEDPIIEVDSELLNNAEILLFRCATCHRGWHMAHLPPRSAPVEDTLDSTADVEDDEVADRFDEYSQGWTCKECFTARGQIDALVAWRPVNTEFYTPGFTAEMMAEDDKEYLVKWRKMSYFHSDWMPGAWVWGVSAAAMRQCFNKKDPAPKMRTEDAIPEEWCRVDIVLDVRYTNIVSNPPQEVQLARVKEVDEAFVKYVGLGYEDAVWEKAPLPSDGDRYNDFKAAYEDWVAGQYIRLPRRDTLRKHLTSVRSVDFEGSMVQKLQPMGMKGGEMMEYQVDGLNWLYYKWFKGQNGILADEMGLGKTIQLIALFSLLVQDHKCWPFLVVVPNATCPNWRREIKKWAPHLRVVAYYGSSVARKLAYDYELFPNHSEELRCHVVIMSYEAVLDIGSKRVLKKTPWQGLVVDEGQRLKNDNNIIYEALRVLRIPFQILLTGM